MTHSAGGGWGSRRRDAHALLPQSEMAQDALDDLPAVYERDDADYPDPFRQKLALIGVERVFAFGEQVVDLKPGKAPRGSRR
jgi:hypothetical protein